MKTPLAPIFNKLGIDKMTSTEEIDKVVSELRSEDGFVGLTEDMLEPVSKETQKNADNFNKNAN